MAKVLSVIFVVLAAIGIAAAEQPMPPADMLATELKDYTFAARITTDNAEDNFILFRKGNDFRMAAWTTGETHKVKIPVDVESVIIVSLAGDRTQKEIKYGQLEIEISNDAKCIEPLGISRRWAVEASWKLSTSTDITPSGLAAEIISESKNAEGVITVSGPGLKPMTMLIASEPDKTTKTSGTTPYVCQGEGDAKVNVAFAVEGIKMPLVRVIDLDMSGCPIIKVLPPAANELWFSISRPSPLTPTLSRPRGGEGVKEDEPLSGTVYVGNTGGLRLATDSCRFEIPKGRTTTTARIKLSQDPAGIYSFSYRVLDDRNNEIVRAKTRRYSVVETFADGKIGDEVRSYTTLHRPKDDAKAKLTYQASPPGAPEDMCARLDYEFDKDSRPICVMPWPMTKIVDRPSIARIWVKGDGKGCVARLELMAHDGRVFQRDYGRLNFDSWKCLDAKMDVEKTTYYPLLWSSIFLLDNTDGQKVKGSIQLGTMMLIYD